MPGQNKSKVGREPVGLKVPSGLHDQMMRLIHDDRTWADRQDFIIAAIREKVDRENARRSGARPSAPAKMA